VTENNASGAGAGRDGTVRRLLVASSAIALVAGAVGGIRGSGWLNAGRAEATPPAATATSAGAPPAVAPTSASTTPPTTLPPAAPRADPPQFPTTVAVAAAVPGAIAVHESPFGPVRTVLRSPAPYSLMPQIFTVIPEPDPSPGWLHVNLRTRPNGSTGWILAADVGLDSHRWSIDINLTEHWATVYDAADVFASTEVVTGTDASPTPVGDYFVTEAVWTPSPGGAYGPYIYGLSAHSDVYTEFAGGDGQIGLHGTNQPGLLGTSASHGCVRFPNDVIRRMADALPMGVPVHIHD
jgi:lipoprotein-anchoring transpeptidase ErfK/SrfK